MIKTRIAILAATAAAIVLPATAALADASTPGHFSYTDAVFGSVSCNEVHHPSDNLPSDVPATATTKGGYDTVTCHLNAPTAFAQANEGKTLTIGWNSDFGTQFDHSTGLISETIDPAGQNYHGVAWYPAG